MHNFSIRFKNYWLKSEQFYTPRWSSVEWKRSVLHLLQNLREQGYHKKLRAGHSLYDLILSRSTVRNLRDGKAHIRFRFDKAGGMVVRYSDKQEELFLNHNATEITSELEIYLDKLVRTPII